jgi:hypothetical protein
LLLPSVAIDGPPQDEDGRAQPNVPLRNLLDLGERRLSIRGVPGGAIITTDGFKFPPDVVPVLTRFQEAVAKLIRTASIA